MKVNNFSSFYEEKNMKIVLFNEPVNYRDNVELVIDE